MEITEWVNPEVPGHPLALPLTDLKGPPPWVAPLQPRSRI